MIWLWDNAVTLGTLVMAVAAVAALIYAHRQISEGRKAEHLANAYELWRETLRVAFDHPKLSDPSLGLADFDYDNRAIDGSVELFQKYELYVDTILNASEEILGVAPTKEWQASVRYQLKPHRAYLLSPHFQNSGYIEQYTPKFRAFVDKVLNEPLPAPMAAPHPNVARIKTSTRKARKRA